MILWRPVKIRAVLSAVSTASAPVLAMWETDSSPGARSESFSASSTRCRLGVEPALAVHHGPGLLGDGLNDAGVAMARRRHAEGGRKIDVYVAVDIDDVGAARTFPENRRLAAWNN